MTQGHADAEILSSYSILCAFVFVFVCPPALLRATVGCTCLLPDNRPSPRPKSCWHEVAVVAVVVVVADVVVGAAVMPTGTLSHPTPCPSFVTALVTT